MRISCCRSRNVRQRSMAWSRWHLRSCSDFLSAFVEFQQREQTFGNDPRQDSAGSHAAAPSHMPNMNRLERAPTSSGTHGQGFLKKNDGEKRETLNQTNQNCFVPHQSRTGLCKTILRSRAAPPAPPLVQNAHPGAGPSCPACVATAVAEAAADTFGDVYAATRVCDRLERQVGE